MSISLLDSSDLEFKSPDGVRSRLDKDDAKAQAFEARSRTKMGSTTRIETTIKPVEDKAQQTRKIHHTSMADMPFSSIPDPPAKEGAIGNIHSRDILHDKETEPLLQKQPSSSGGMSDIHAPIEDSAGHLPSSAEQSLPASTLKSRIATKQEDLKQGINSVLEKQREQLTSLQQTVAPVIAKASSFVRRNNLQVPLIALGALLALLIGASLLGPHLWSRSSTPMRPVESMPLHDDRPLQDVPGPGMLDRAKMKLHAADESLLSATHSLGDQIRSGLDGVRSKIMPGSDSIAIPQGSPNPEDHVIERKARSGVVLEQLDTMPIPQPTLLESAQDEMDAAKARISGIGASVQDRLSGVKQTIQRGAAQLKSHLPGQTDVGSGPGSADILNPDDHVIEMKSHGHVLETLDVPSADPALSVIDRLSDAMASGKEEITQRVADMMPKAKVDLPTVEDTRQAATDAKGSVLHSVRDALANVRHKVGNAMPSLDAIKAKAAGLVGRAPGMAQPVAGGIHADVLNPEDHIIEQKVEGGVVEKLDV